MDPSLVSAPGALLIGDQAATTRVSIGRGGAIVVDNATTPAAITFPQLTGLSATSASTLAAGSVTCTAGTVGALTTAALTAGPVACASLASAAGATQSQCTVRV